jgi:hypothetical protein
MIIIAHFTLADNLDFQKAARHHHIAHGTTDIFPLWST